MKRMYDERMLELDKEVEMINAGKTFCSSVICSSRLIHSLPSTLFFYSPNAAIGFSSLNRNTPRAVVTDARDPCEAGTETSNSKEMADT